MIERAKEIPEYLAKEDLGNKALNEILKQMNTRIENLEESILVTCTQTHF